METIKRKTLVLNYNTKYAEYFGWEDGIGWCTAASPIHLFMEEIDWDIIKKKWPEASFNNIELITVEIKAI